MNSIILNEEKNPFLGRKELVIEIEADTSPSYDDVKKIVGADEKLVVIRKVFGNFGTHNFPS